MKTSEEKNARRRELAAIKKNIQAVNTNEIMQMITELKDIPMRLLPNEKNETFLAFVPANKVVDSIPEKPRRVIIKEERINPKGKPEWHVAMWTNSGMRQAIYCEFEEYADAAVEGMQNLAMKLYKQAFPVETRIKEEN